MAGAGLLRRPPPRGPFHPRSRACKPYTLTLTLTLTLTITRTLSLSLTLNLNPKP